MIEWVKDGEGGGTIYPLSLLAGEGSGSKGCEQGMEGAS